MPHGPDAPGASSLGRHGRSCCFSPIAISPPSPTRSWPKWASAAPITACCISSTAIRACASPICWQSCKITKQSLARVLKQLIDEGYVAQATGASDRRERRLHPTDKARPRLADRLLALQTHRIADALASRRSRTPSSAPQRFLAGVIAPEDRARPSAWSACAGAPADARRRAGRAT